ncbi:MAG: 4-(cytidine 5'-diphospho)-2-C-methyl-D-erythritol kinase [Chitinivibrionales bacterium]|nr:4-(cytidine 5'-diphospho)-2-C-methyl-D-erythritol kinase [Chitinivibrionales bacterium]
MRNGDCSMPSRKAYARITPALDIVKKLADGECKGFHELGIIKHQIGLYDMVHLEKADTMEVVCDRDGVPCDKTNICWKAVESIKQEFGIGENARITLTKNIPARGGLAGGSSNAAATLLLADELWGLNLSRKQLCSLGGKLGMDVPYFFYGKTAFDTESTGILQPISTDMRFYFILVIPEIGVSTKEAYGSIDYSAINRHREMTERMEQALGENNYDMVVKSIHNDFELSVFQSHPELQNIRDTLINAGCHAAFMSGSGSTIVGVVRDQREALTVCNRVNYTTIIASTL